MIQFDVNDEVGFTIDGEKYADKVSCVSINLYPDLPTHVEYFMENYDDGPLTSDKLVLLKSAHQHTQVPTPMADFGSVIKFTSDFIEGGPHALVVNKIEIVCGYEDPEVRYFGAAFDDWVRAEEVITYYPKE